MTEAALLGSTIALDSAALHLRPYEAEDDVALPVVFMEKLPA